MNWLILLPFLCLFGCAGASATRETQYITGPTVPDAPHRPAARHTTPSNADIQEQIDALSRSIDELKSKIGEQ
jgi:hypothetical protein